MDSKYMIVEILENCENTDQTLSLFSSLQHLSQAEFVTAPATPS